MTTVSLREAAYGIAPITASQARALEEVGAQLASSSQWWGEDDQQAVSDRSLIHCRRTPSGDWQVWVHNAVGVIRIGDLELLVQPKIDLAHFLYLFERAAVLPRHGDAPTTLEIAPDLWRLVARWYVAELEHVLKLGLIPDYVPHIDALPFARGSIQPRETVRGYYTGRLALVCRYDEFALDTPANRVLRAAARTVTAAPGLDWQLRRRAQLVNQVLDDARNLQPGDLAVVQQLRDRRLAHYRPALTLADQVLRHTGRTLAAGAHTVWTFLLPTPKAIERGIRQVLRDAFGFAVHPTASATVAGVGFNPDILFPGRATADVKYKLATGTWDRADLYQAIAFATAFEVGAGAVFNFSTTRTQLPVATPGRLRIRHIPWYAAAAIDPHDAAQDFVWRVGTWLSDVW